MLPTAARGYGAAHQRLRRQLDPVVAAGGVACARCGLPIVPGTPWELDHTPDRTSYLGPSHKSCNRRAKKRRRRTFVSAEEMSIAYARQHELDMARLERERAELVERQPAPSPRIW